jgi:hypothetical protein
MIKQQYIQMRNAGNIDVNWFYRYFMEEGGKATPQDFFDNFYYRIEKVPVPGGFVEHREERDLRPILTHLDKKFDLTLLFDKTGQFLKIVE